MKTTAGERSVKYWSVGICEHVAHNYFMTFQLPVDKHGTTKQWAKWNVARSYSRCCKFMTRSNLRNWKNHKGLEKRFANKSVYTIQQKALEKLRYTVLTLVDTTGRVVRYEQCLYHFPLCKIMSVIFKGSFAHLGSSSWNVWFGCMRRLQQSSCQDEHVEYCWLKY